MQTIFDLEDIFRFRKEKQVTYRKLTFLIDLIDWRLLSQFKKKKQEKNTRYAENACNQRKDKLLKHCGYEKISENSNGFLVFKKKLGKCEITHHGIMCNRPNSLSCEWCLTVQSQRDTGIFQMNSSKYNVHVCMLLS